MIFIPGECNGKGFYKYDNCGKAGPDPELRKYIIKASHVWNVTIDSKVSLSLSLCVLTYSQARHMFLWTHKLRGNVINDLLLKIMHAQTWWLTKSIQGNSCLDVVRPDPDKPITNALLLAC